MNGATHVQIKVTGTGGEQTFNVDPTLLGDYLRTLELSVNGSPVVRVPFSMHDGGLLHTVCREDGRVEPVEM